MKHQPPIHPTNASTSFFTTFIVTTFIILANWLNPGTVRSQPSSNQCKTIKDEIATLQNEMAALEKSKATAPDDMEIEAARTAMSMLNKLITKLQNEPWSNPGKGQSDKEYLVELLEDAFIIVENQTDNKGFLEVSIAKDVDQNGKLLNSRPTYTISALKQVRDMLAKNIDNAKTVENKGQIDEKIEGLKNKIKADQQRLAALNCDSKVPGPDEGDAKTQCEKNQKRIDQLKLELQQLAYKQAEKGIWNDEKLARAKTAKASAERLKSELNRYPAMRPDGRKQDINDLKSIDMQLVPIVAAYGDHKEYLKAYRADVQNDKMVSDRMTNTIWYVERLIYDIESAISDETAKRTRNPDAIALDKQIAAANQELAACKSKMETLKCFQLANKGEKKETKPEMKVETKPEKKDQPVTTSGPPPLPETIELTEHYEKYGNYTITLKRKTGNTYEGIYSTGKSGVFRLVTYQDNVFKLERDYYADIKMGQHYLGNYKPGSASGKIISGGTFYAVLK
jgi:hypothetical protein